MAAATSTIADEYEGDYDLDDEFDDDNDDGDCRYRAFHGQMEQPCYEHLSLSFV